MILYFTSPLTVGIDPSEETADLMLKRRTRLTAICVVTVAVVSVVSLVTSVVAVGAALVILVAILPMDYPWSAV